MPSIYGQTQVHALLDVLPLPIMTFEATGKLTFSNKAAKQHLENPVESLSGKPVIKNVAKAFALGKLKPPCTVKLSLDGDRIILGEFTYGLSGLDLALVIKHTNEAGTAAPGTSTAKIDPSEAALTTRKPAGPHKSMADIIGLLRDEVGPPLHRLLGLFENFKGNPETTPIKLAVQALDQRLGRISDLISVFGDEVLMSEDRIETIALVRSVCKELEPLATSRKVYFEIVEPEQSFPALYGNTNILRRAFHECLENAINHSREEIDNQQLLAIKVQASLVGEYFLLTIRNKGALPNNSRTIEAGPLFANPQADINAQGSGRLGLPLAERIVVLFGGNIRISASGGEEVCVMIELPTGAPRRGQADLKVAQTQRYAADLAKLLHLRKKDK